MAKILSIDTDKRGFFSPEDRCGDPISSTKEGIFVCGCATGPKDITDSIAEASGAAIRAAQYLMKDKLPENNRRNTVFTIIVVHHVPVYLSVIADPILPVWLMLEICYL